MYEKVLKVFNACRNKFVYMTDLNQYKQREHWTSQYKKVIANKYWHDDCDGFALTCAEYAIRKAKIPRKFVRLIYCMTETGGGHLVCGIDVDAETLILDNRQRVVEGWKTLTGYTWNSSMRLSEPGIWRKI